VPAPLLSKPRRQDGDRASSGRLLARNRTAGRAAVAAPGGLVGAAITLGARITLVGPSTAWFVHLGATVTGRTWYQVDAAQARDLIASTPTLVKLADAKLPNLPARRYPTVAEFDAALARIGPIGDIELLATPTWLDIHSEYRVFTNQRDALTCSPYLIEDEPWSPLLHTHRASFHREAAAHTTALLADLPENEVPPAAALDIARLANGHFVVLEANQSWSAGLYGCDPDAVLQSVFTANTAAQSGAWRWSPPTGLPCRTD
jgi:hypothetical protein